MALEPTLEELRPREWQVSWEYPDNPSLLDGRWFAQDRMWPEEGPAVRHAHALDAMGAATGEIRNVEVHSRMTKLECGQWVPVQWI